MAGYFHGSCIYTIIIIISIIIVIILVCVCRGEAAMNNTVGTVCRCGLVSLFRSLFGFDFVLHCKSLGSPSGWRSTTPYRAIPYRTWSNPTGVPTESRYRSFHQLGRPPTRAAAANDHERNGRSVGRSVGGVCVSLCVSVCLGVAVRAVKTTLFCHNDAGAVSPHIILQPTAAESAAESAAAVK